MEELHKEVHDYMKEWGENKVTMMKMREETKEKVGKEGKSWKEGMRV